MSPVYPSDRRIRAHVLLCWLALLLIRVAETNLQDTWTSIRDTMQRLGCLDKEVPSDLVERAREATPRFV